jgi:hypothetical protein
MVDIFTTSLKKQLLVPFDHLSSIESGANDEVDEGEEVLEVL